MNERGRAKRREGGVLGEGGKEKHRKTGAQRDLV